MDIPGKIRKLRADRNITQQQLADSINKTLSSVKKYETGKVTLTIDTLYDISKALDVPINYFFSNSNESLINSFIDQYGLCLSEKELDELRIEFNFMIDILVNKYKK